MARVLSLVLCALVVAFSLPRGAFMLVAMFGLYAVSSVSELSLYRKGLAPAPDGNEEKDPGLADAEALGGQVVAQDLALGGLIFDHEYF